ncbi:YraN family protein [Christensenellaceae bacterium OttesenSCG-928-L17]|nr:YraN family protein [Christensenellaceae bacterium OttesenSCG-928-L17]
MNTREIGRRAEQRAREYLEARGLLFVAANVYFGHNEIDLIMQDGAYTVFVEVKARSDERYGLGREFVGRQKQKRLLLAAQDYLNTHDPDAFARFDVVEINLTTDEIVHIPNAFSVE